MVFDKQHLRFFVTFAFLLAQVHTVPLAQTALSNDSSVQRLRGDLHQFIEMIIKCLTDSSSGKHPNLDPTQLQEFTKLSNTLQEDIGIPVQTTTGYTDSHQGEEGERDAKPENKIDDHQSGEPLILRKFADNSENSKDSKDSSEETKGNTNKENDTESDENTKTTKPDTTDIINPTEKTVTFTQADLDKEIEAVGLRMLNIGNKEMSTEQPTTNTHSSIETMDTNTPAMDVAASKENSEENMSDAIKSQIKKNLQPFLDSMQKHSTKKESAEESTISNDSKENVGIEATDGNNLNEEIQVRSLIKPDQPQYAKDNALKPYEALHIYGVQVDGPISRIVFEGGEHHQPRPLTIKESNHLKEFIKMVINTNKMNNPLATFPKQEQGDDVVARIGQGNVHPSQNSAWADKPVPLELV